MSQTSATPAPPPPTPRPLSRAVRRRAWGDPRARFWSLAWAVLLVVGGCLLVGRAVGWWRDSRLSVHGTLVQATIMHPEPVGLIPGRTLPGDSRVRIRYEFDGQTHEYVVPYLDGRRPEDFLVTGKTIPIRVDPNNPSRWTPRDTPAPLAPELIGGEIVVGIGAVVFLLAFAFRRRLLGTWQEAKGVAAMTLEARHTALSPRAWAVRCSPVEEGDDRVFEVFVPSGTDVAEGALLWILLPDRGSPVAAKWFDR